MSDMLGEKAAMEVAVPQKQGALARQEEAIRFLHDRIDLLSSRLEGVMSAQLPAQAVMSDTTSFFEGMIVEIQGAAGRIDEIISRLVL